MRYAMFSSEPMSFTATNSNSGVSRISFSAARPIRPRPLIATFTAIYFPPLNRNVDRPRFDSKIQALLPDQCGFTEPCKESTTSAEAALPVPPLRTLPYLRLMLYLPDKSFQGPGVVVSCVLGAEEERNVLLSGPLCDVA